MDKKENPEADPVGPSRFLEALKGCFRTNKMLFADWEVEFFKTGNFEQ